MNRGICAFCGIETIVTNDHLPPRNIFPKPQPNEVDLISVPACKECNQGSSQDDEEFKIYISLKSGMEGSASLKLHESTKRTLRHNKKLRNQLIQNTIRLPQVLDCVSKFNPNPIRRVGEKIIEGLFFKHMGECLRGKGEISIYLSEEIHNGNLAVIKDLAKDTGKYGEHNTVGANAEFKYVFAKTEVNYATSWILIFNERCAIVGLTLPKTT